MILPAKVRLFSRTEGRSCSTLAVAEICSSLTAKHVQESVSQPLVKKTVKKRITQPYCYSSSRGKLCRTPSAGSRTSSLAHRVWLCSLSTSINCRLQNNSLEVSNQRTEAAFPLYPGMCTYSHGAALQSPSPAIDGRWQDHARFSCKSQPRAEPP